MCNRSMTHPDILKMEKFGSLNPSESTETLGLCAECGAIVTSDFPCFENRDGDIFCDIECVKNYYGLHECKA